MVKKNFFVTPIISLLKQRFEKDAEFTNMIIRQPSNQNNFITDVSDGMIWKNLNTILLEK